MHWVQKNCIQLILYKKKQKKVLEPALYKENSHVFVNGTEIIKFTSKDPEILPHPLWLINIWKDWSLYDFSVDSDAITTDDILDFHRYLMKKNMI